MYNAIFYITLFIGLIPFLILLEKKKASDFKEPILPFIWLTVLATLYEFVGTRIFRLNTTYWFQFYSLIEFLTILFFYWKIYKSKYSTRIFYIFLVFCSITYLISFLFWNKDSSLIPKALNKIPLTIGILIFSLIWFKNNLEKSKYEAIHEKSTFYFVSGFFIYYLSTFFLFLLSDFIFKNDMHFYNYWIINIIATFLLRLFLIIGVWKMK